MTILCPSSFMCSYLLSNFSHPSCFFLVLGRKTHSPHLPEYCAQFPQDWLSIPACLQDTVSPVALLPSGLAMLLIHAEWGYGLSIKFRGLKNLSLLAHFSLLLDKLCPWHPNYGVQKLISDVFLNRITSQNPSFSSCKHMFHFTPLKPYQIQSAREQRITYSRP